jgi:streptogramin lyase
MRTKGVLAALLVAAGVPALASTATTTSAPKIVASFHFSSAPQAIVAGDGGVWLTTVHALVRIDPRTSKVTQLLQLKPVLGFGAVTMSGRQLWLARNPIDTGKTTPAPSQLWSLDTVSGQLRGPPVSFQLIASLAAAAGAIWVTNGDHAQYGRLFQIDPRRRRIVAKFEIPGAPSGVVWARGLLWIVASDTGYLFRVDPHTAKLVGKPVRAGKALLTVAADKERIWVGDSYAGAVNSVDAVSGRVITRTKLPHVSDVAVGDGAVWATVDKPGELVRLDPKTGAPVGQPLPVPRTASGIAIAFGSIWVMTGDGVVRVQPSE